MMRWKKQLWTFLLGMGCAALVGTGSLVAVDESHAKGPPGGLAVEVTNEPGNPIPVVGQVTGQITGTVQAEQSGDWVVGSEQVGEWEVSIPDGIAIDPSQNEVRVEKGTRRLAFRDIFLDGDTPAEAFDVDLRGSTKIRIAITVNGSSRNVNVSLTSKLHGADSGSFLDFWETSTSAGNRTRVYDLPGEELHVRVSQGGGNHQAIVTIWGD
jgi:hypothetical protein